MGEEKKMSDAEAEEWRKKKIAELKKTGDTKNVEEQPVQVVEKYYCKNCQVTLDKDGVKKLPLDYNKDANDKLTPANVRFSIFCGNCEGFIGIRTESNFVGSTSTGVSR